MSERRFSIHGIGLILKTESERMRGLAERVLGKFAVARRPAHAITWRLFEMPADKALRLKVPRGCVRLHTSRFWPGERIRYWADGEELYFETVGRCLIRFQWRQKAVTGWVTQTKGWNIARLMFYPVCAELLRRSGLFPIHAAGVVKQGRAVLFAGRGGSGKTTSALALARHGFRLLADDVVVLSTRGRGLRILPWPQPIRVTKKTAVMIPEIQHLRRIPGRLKRNFEFEDVYAGRLSSSGRPALLFFPQLTRRPGHAADPISSSEALRRLLPNSLYIVDSQIAVKHFEALARLTDGCRSYVLRTGANIDDLPEFVDRLLAAST